jgi:hypothetical protein
MKTAECLTVFLSIMVFFIFKIIFWEQLKVPGILSNSSGWHASLREQKFHLQIAWES